MKIYALPAAATIMICALCLVSQPLAQTTARGDSNRRSSKRPANAITGRLLSDSGQPLFNVAVSISEVGRRRVGSRSANTDEEGRFRFNDLPRGNYLIIPRAPGYVFEQPPEPRYYRPGDEVGLTAMKGGVITGAVTNSLGEPIVEARVRSIRLRDINGLALRQTIQDGQTLTDDRGQYRVYGLRPGVYLLLVGGGRGYSSMDANPYNRDVATYYPSSTRDTAAEIVVASGQEVAGIDVRYRGERGSAISGSISDAISFSSNTGISVELYNASTHSIEAHAFAYSANPKRTFEFHGVSDGDYYLVSVAQQNNQNSATSARYPVRVRGADVTGIQLSLIPDGSISGTAILERAQAEDVKSRCEPARDLAPEELLVISRRDHKDAAKDTARPGDPVSGSRVPPDDKGQFILRNLQPGRYRIDTYLPEESWYVRSIIMPAPARSKTPVDASQIGISVKAGERVSGLTVIIAEGAASVAGQVTPAREGAALPARLKVHIVPAEREQADNPLRFKETTVRPDGSFSLSNIAPGKYLLLARPAPAENDLTAPARPAAWDAEQRKSLGQEATAAGVSLDLQPCQRAAGFSLKYATPAKPARKAAASNAGQ